MKCFCKSEPNAFFAPLVVSVVLGLLVPNVVGCPADDDSPAQADTGDVALDTVDVAAETDDDAGGCDGCDLTEEDADTDVIRVSNAQIGGEIMLLTPDEGEEGFLCAARLTPPQYPFIVEQIEYPIGHSTGDDEPRCNASFEHHVFVLSSAELAPPVDLDEAADYVVAGVAEDDIPEGGRYVVVPLDEPITVNDGEHLFVAVQLAGTFPEMTCTSVDVSSTHHGNRNYWSNSAESPFTWVQLDSFGLTGNIIVDAVGYLP